MKKLRPSLWLLLALVLVASTQVCHGSTESKTAEPTKPAPKAKTSTTDTHTKPAASATEPVVKAAPKPAVDGLTKSEPAEEKPAAKPTTKPVQPVKAAPAPKTLPDPVKPAPETVPKPVTPAPSAKKGHILFFHNAGTRSHLIVMNALAEGLAEDGHKVTTVFYGKMSKKNLPNLNQLVIDDRLKTIYKEFSKMIMEEGMSPFNLKYWYMGYEFWTKNKNICIDSIKERPELVKMIEDKTKVDIVMSMGSCGQLLGKLLDAKVVNFCPAGIVAMHSKATGNAVNPFVQPSLIHPTIEPMSFPRRALNVFLEGFVGLYTDFMAGLEKATVQEAFPGQIPDDYEVWNKERTVLSLANSNVATHGTWPSYENNVEIGGIHCKPGEELPADLKKYMDSHPEGVVLVSFGSALSASQLKPEQQKMFKATFKELGTPVIWKWDSDDLTDMPENVMVSKWLPQNDLLAHPNLRAFVTHGGLLSTQESLFHSVPLVGVPLANDQEGNLQRAERNGFAIRLDLQTLKKEEFLAAIKRALTDPIMQKAVATMHSVFTDKTLTGMSPMERGVAAINYVIEDRGVEYLKPHIDVLNMPFFQIHGYDILIFFTVIIAIVLTISWKCLRCCCGLCCGSKKAKQD